MSRNLFTTLFSALTALTLLASCLEPDYDYFGLSVQARGLANNETITVSNGSTLEISGNKALDWTEPQRFKQGYRSDRTNYDVRITRQPSNSSKSCRVLNPSGHAGHANNMVRIECGYPVVVADTQMTMTSDNGLIVSNQFQERALNASRMLVTSLLHEVVQDPTSTDQNDKKLRVTPQRQDGAITFSELYLEGDPVTLSFSSINQGCQLAGASSNSRLSFDFPSPDAFTNTVQTKALDKDWISNDAKLGNGRTCQDFEGADEYLLDYSAEEKPKGTNSYTSTCYPADLIEMTCGFALQLQVRGLDDGDSLIVTANRDGSIDHEITFETNSTRTFNLAFVNGETYNITIDSVDTTPLKTCNFKDTGNGVFGSSNTKEVITCEP